MPGDELGSLALLAARGASAKLFAAAQCVSIVLLYDTTAAAAGCSAPTASRCGDLPGPQLGARCHGPRLKKTAGPGRCSRQAMAAAEIEKATRRVVALRVSRNLSQAAARLGMAPVSLWRWILRRKLPTFIPVP